MMSPEDTPSASGTLRGSFADGWALTFHEMHKHNKIEMGSERRVGISGALVLMKKSILNIRGIFWLYIRGIPLQDYYMRLLRARGNFYSAVVTTGLSMLNKNNPGHADSFCFNE
ncbi:MAG TPA: hypothetical protein VMT76_08750 [Puia sp.]|nr:hypothetical protein [Puia sp.]